MPRIPTIYLETTIFNFPFANDAPQYQADTLKLFEEIKNGKFKPFTSVYVKQELEAAPESMRKERLQLIQEYKVEVLQANKEAERLAKLYIKEKIIPGRYLTDAFHIAAATVAGMDYIISLNFRHIVKHKTIFETEVINTREGFKRVFIHTPAEVIDHEKEL